MIRFFISSRRNAEPLPEKAWARTPRIPWDEINAAKRAASYQQSAKIKS